MQLHLRGVVACTVLAFSSHFSHPTSHGTSITCTMTSRERIKTTLNFKIPDRVGIYDCLADQTRQEWERQGLLPERQPYEDFFGFDLRLFGFDQSFLLADNDQRGQGTTIKNRRQWQELAVLLAPCRQRIDSSFENRYKAAKQAGLFLALSVLDPFQHAAGILGLENLLLFMAEDPGFVKDIFSRSADLSVDMCGLLSGQGFKFDGAWLWADIAYKAGCYFSCDMYKRLLYPCHKRLCRFFNSKGMPVIFHSDGDVRGIAPFLVKAGIRALNPLQIYRGFDIAFIKKEYGRDLVLIGGMPTDILHKGKRQIEEALSKRLELAKKGGGFIYHSESPIPRTAPFENYVFALDMVRKYGVY